MYVLWFLLRWTFWWQINFLLFKGKFQDGTLNRVIDFIRDANVNYPDDVM